MRRRRRRCRRCGAQLVDERPYCGRCGTLQAVAAAAQAPPGWYRDPFERGDYRWFNGELWSEHVYSNGYGRDVVTFEDTDRRGGPWRASPSSLALSIGGLAVAFGLSFLFVLPFLLLGHPGGIIVSLVLSEAGLWVGLVGTCVLASRRYGTGRLVADFDVRARLLDAPIGVLGAVVGRCVAGAVLIPFAHLLKSLANPDKGLYAITSLGAAGWTALVVLTCLGAPIFEELFFRGLLQSQLVERFGPVVAITVTSVLFGAAHIANDPGVGGLLLALSVGAGGLVLGTVRHLTGRLGSSMATHALFNAAAVAVLAAAGTLR